MEFLNHIHAVADYVTHSLGIHPIGGYVIVGLVLFGVLRGIMRTLLTFRVVKIDGTRDPVRQVIAWIMLLVLTFALLWLARQALPPGAPV